MPSVEINSQPNEAMSPLSPVPEESNWYAIHTMARHEKRVVQRLQEKRIFTFLPLVQQIHRWTDRWHKVEVPLFSCYAFVRIAPTAENRVRVLNIPGVLAFVGSERQGTPIPDQEIENLQLANREKIPCTMHPFVSAGRRMRIQGGSLHGVEGILVGQGKNQSLILSVELLGRSVAIRVQGYAFEVV